MGCLSSYYTHTLISQDREFAPQPQQVSEFFRALIVLGSAPHQAQFRIGTIAGIRTGTDPVTGATLSMPRWSYVTLAASDKPHYKLRGLDAYNAVMAGQGPPKRLPFELYTVDDNGDYTKLFVEPYDFQLECRLRSEAASMSDWHEDISRPPEGIAPFGELCSGKHKNRFFHHPRTGALFEAPGVACARFWIEFQCGKLLLPRIGNDLNVLATPIVQAAERVFETGFIQGCHWG
jgi:hypothetical protein